MFSGAGAHARSGSFFFFYYSASMSVLYIVATPIGNLEDITLRALRILKEAEVILCEDTRQTKKLLERHGIGDKQLTAYNEKKSGVALQKIFGWLAEGKNLALVSDAGTPGISDPGVMLVREVRKQLPEVSVIPIPGPTALIAALSASGIPAADFLFLGFLPHKKGRETLFKEIAGSKRTIIFYESPHRILKTLHSLSSHLGSQRVVIARELTKIHEEFQTDTASNLLAYFTEHPDKVRGEFVVLIEPL